MMITPILRQQGRDRVELTREIIKPVIKDIETLIKRFDILDIFAKMRLGREIERFREDFSYDLKKFLFDKLLHIIHMTLTSYNDLLPTPLDSQHLSQLEWEILTDIVEEPFFDMTLDERVDRSVIRTFMALKQETDLSIPTPSKPRELIKQTHSHFLSFGQVSDGSAILWNTRLLVGEENRAYQEAAKVILAAGGIKEIRWVNNPDKPTSVLCQHYASENGGIYPIHAIPQYPHTGCCCSIELVIE